MKVTKHQRQHRITKLLETRAVGSQTHLVELLAGEGIEATQATVSRDLEELGALKVRLPGGDTAYALPELPSHQVAPEDHLRRILGEWVVEAAFSGNLVVLRTPPGSAHVVGSALDRSGFPGVIGTVAGDDTVLVVAAEVAGGAGVAARLAAVSGLEALSGPAGAMLPDNAGIPLPAGAARSSNGSTAASVSTPADRKAGEAKAHAGTSSGAKADAGISSGTNSGPNSTKSKSGSGTERASHVESNTSKKRG
ncbi:MAG TPA: arginine repressor [Acidimicrobiales bacterium]|jgi:transcriptional regulator of arginine metabolism|nr:arginine repressor [Acidimicrobiales bacterium]